ncbi:M61 family metallopeptidase [Chitinasiproducens palmae]|uniref:Predicted metalloprotease, contains C-terminal PDZ domain n=1 Tax=Chitinasiproducens palmae TaxID=1770053 RepID=A0A1H2PTJ0_9BURK|nr:PDZ domain-containing protein [Chitinasiproducens palmae]SDV50431.1 Predicted metalloprotease, contains C-terminal PDZ domain [Chitinasiproducens palmae]
MNPIRYTIRPSRPAAHVFEVTLTVAEPAADGQRFFLPVWIPGSYMVREFSRNIVTIGARAASGRRVALTKLDKHTWQAAPCKGPLTLRYEVYAWDLSVRSAYLDDTIGFFNGTSVFLAVVGQETAPCSVTIEAPAGVSGWRVATCLREARGTRRYGFGDYLADDYDELIDHPVTLGLFQSTTFEAHGVPHDIVISGAVPGLDLPRLAADLQRICERQIAMFEPRTRRAPMTRYVFMTMAVGDGYGGLEHRASTALIANRDDLPLRGVAEVGEGYRTYLGLCSHEYFHTWNVKRIKPDSFVDYDLSRENYTTLLWLFEGFTSYYDDLTLVRSGLIDANAYFGLLGKTIANVERGSGRLKQTVAESSFDAWTKYYRQDENASNAIVSYYTKGSLVALAFDLAIRARSESRRSLDDFMRLLWQRFGRDFYRGRKRGVDAADVLALIEESTGVDLSDLFAQAVDSTRDLPFEALFAPFGLSLEAVPVAGSRVSLGAKVRPDGVLAAVYDNGPAQAAGLSASDTLVAVDGLRVTGGNLEKLLTRYAPRQQIEIHAFRRDVLRSFRLTLAPADVSHFRLLASDTRAGRALRNAWLR